jgi:hypothetical protein
VRRPRPEWRRKTAPVALAVNLASAAMMAAAGQPALCAGFVLFGLGCGRWLRGWPWLARWLFRREIRKTRHVERDGRAETLFAYPFTAPVERRRAVPKEPRMRRARRGD